MRRFFMGFLLLLTACQRDFKFVDLPEMGHEYALYAVEERDMGQTLTQSLLSVQFMPESWRFVWVEPLGAPLARLLLQEGRWQRDGFVMPNRKAEDLFFLFSFALAPENPPFLLQNGQFLQGKEGFLVLTEKAVLWSEGEVVWLVFKGGRTWRFTLLEAQ